MRHLLFSVLLSIICLCSAAQNISSYTFTRHEITAVLDFNPDARAAAFLAPYTPAVDSTMSPILGWCEGGMTVGRPESPLSNWVADALREAATEHFGTQADVALTNMGGLRSVMPAGEVKQGYVFEIAPFENYLCLVTLTGANLRELCRNIASRYGEGISGLRIVADKRGNLLDAKVNGAPIDDAREYTVATLNYLADGNDHMTALTRASRRQDTTVPVREILINTIRRATAAGLPITSQVEGRMQIIQDGAPMHQSPDNSQSKTQNSKLKTLNSQLSTLNSQLSTLNSQLSTLNSQLSTQNCLRVLHTNDTHSQIQPFNPNSIDREAADKAGFVRRATFIAQQRALTPDLLLLDAGDFSQGSLYYNIYKGEVEVGLMNVMGYDACTIGNHEFDFGMDNMARLYRMANFPVVCCNYDFTGTVLEDIVKPYTVITRGSLRIGILGISCDPEGLIAAHNCRGLVYHDPIEVVPAVVEKLRGDEHCDIVICLSHMGWNIDGTDDTEVIAATHGIDLFIGGHTHTYMERPQWVKNADGRETPCYQMGKMGRYVGDITLDIK